MFDLEIMKRQTTSTNVLIIHEDPAVLILLGRLLERDGMRALFARNAAEAAEIAARAYVPIDLVLAGLSGESGFAEPESAAALDRVRTLRPGVRTLQMAARTEGGAIRIDSAPNETGGTLFENIAGVLAAAAPEVNLRYPYQ